MVENKTRTEILKEEITSNLVDFDFEDGSCFTPEALSEALKGVNEWAVAYFEVIRCHPEAFQRNKPESTHKEFILSTPICIGVRDYENMVCDICLLQNACNQITELIFYGFLAKPPRDRQPDGNSLDTV